MTAHDKKDERVFLSRYSIDPEIIEKQTETIRSGFRREFDEGPAQELTRLATAPRSDPAIAPGDPPRVLANHAAWHDLQPIDVVTDSDCHIVAGGAPYEWVYPEAEVVLPESGPPYSLSSHVVAGTGEISVGAANGRLKDSTYLSDHSWLFGDANTSEASVIRVFQIPPDRFVGSLSVANIRVTVQVPRPQVLLVHGREGSTGRGLVGVFAQVNLTVIPSSLVAMGPARGVSRDLCRIWSTVDDTSGEQVSGLLELSESVALRHPPHGGSWVAAMVTLSVLAFRAGVGDPNGGFSGIHYWRSGETPLWPGFFSNAPVRLRTIRFRHCPMHFIPVAELGMGT